MRTYLLLPLALMCGCQTVKNSNANVHHEQQLLNDVKELSSDRYQGRKTGTQGSVLARDYIKKRFKEIGLLPYQRNPLYEQGFDFMDDDGKSLTGRNVVGYIKGKSDKAMVISAHYDHLGVFDQAIYNGADDNASGVAGMLKIAAHYAKVKPHHTLIFVAFDAGEQNWRGSKAFVNEPPVPLSSIVLNVNLDMISQNEKQELFAAGTYKHPELKNYIIQSNPNLRVLFGHDNPKQKVDDWTDQSDQGAFDDVNIPWIYFGVEDHKDYHRPTDKFENIQQQFFKDAANAILEIVDNIDQQKNLQSIFREKLQMKKR